VMCITAHCDGSTWNDLTDQENQVLYGVQDGR